MPPPPHRKKPFSSKQKKGQLKAKRDKKRQEEEHDTHSSHQSAHTQNTEDGSENGEMTSNVEAKRINQQPGGKSTTGYDPNRYRLHFQRDSQEEIAQRKSRAMKPFMPLPEDELECNMDDIYRPGSELDMPKRPKWCYSMNKEQLQMGEEKYFQNYVESILAKYEGDEVSYFELNLETWRQLWRVLEMADIVLLITDIRHPAFHFSPALYDYVTRECKKELILILNKVDLAPAPLVVAWKDYFHRKFPSLHIVCFTSFPKETDPEEKKTDANKVIHKKRRKGAFIAAGPIQLLKACENIVQNRVDLSTWKERMTMMENDSGSPEAEVRMEEVSTDHSVRYKDGILTIGCCGYPNVGKSSLMNGLVGKKVVSVSRTPGHTKHFQTIYLTPTVKLCDSPGIVFPSVIPKAMQILAGIYPIAQVREPYTAVGYITQHLPLPALLKLRHPDAEPHQPQPAGLQWSAYDVCEGWAERRGYFTAKAGRLDTYRAANSLLRLSVEGRICLCTAPPGYTKQKDDWKHHPDTLEITALQEAHRRATGSDTEAGPELYASQSDSDEEEEDARGMVDNSSHQQQNSDNDTAITNNPFALLSGD